MAFDSLKDRMGGKEQLMPMQIAHHSLFTAREKLDLLHQLKGQVQGALEDGADLGFTPDEIDGAIAEVRAGAQADVGRKTVAWGDY